MKKNVMSYLLFKGRWCKIMMLMKLKLFILIFSIGTLQAKSYSQAAKFNMNKSQIEISQLLEEIQEEADCQFFYQKSIFKDESKIDVSVKEASLDELLDEVLVKNGYVYEKYNNIVTIKRNREIQQPQEQRTISGVIIDSDGMPIPGANIMVLDAAGRTIHGSVTNHEGRYEMQLPMLDNYSGLTLSFSFIGMVTQNIVYADQVELNVTMASDAEELGEVVVTGAFTRKSNTYTGAVTSVKREDLLKMSTQNVLDGLASFDPSFVQVTNLSAGSNPNSMPNYQLRGTSSISQNLQSEYENDPNQPLFILDGFETTLEKVNDMDINMIESITLLKDATAKAIYGSKGANGVVVVESRRPVGGKMRLTYNGGVSLEMPDLSSYDLANAAEKLEIERMAGLYESDNYLSQLTLDRTYNNKLMEVMGGVDTDWLAQPVHTGVGQKHSVYLDGGDGPMLYGIDLYYNNINGAMRGSNRETLSGGVTLTYRKDKFLIRNRVAITYNEATNSPYGEFSTYALMNPYSRLYDENGDIIQSYNYNNTLQPNPIWNTTINTKDQSSYTDITDNFYGEYTIKQGLKLIGRMSISTKETSSDVFKPASHTDFLNYTDVLRKGSYEKSNGKSVYFNGDLGVSYSFMKGNHLLFTNGQVNFSNTSYNRATYVAEGFPNDEMDHVIFGVQYADGEKPTGAEGISHSAGGLLSANYSYDERYLLDANYRLTGSSEYGANNRWGHFWSVGAGWNIHKEAFLYDSSVISLLKLRYSMGYTGSQGFNTYESLSTARYYQSDVYYGNIGSYLVSLANPDLAWQSKYDQSVGVDYALFKSKISGRFDYYVSNTEDMLTDVTVPPSTGFSYYRANLGKTQNKGVEANLNVRVLKSKTGNDYLNVFASLAHNKNTLKEISNSLKTFNDAQDEAKSEADDEDNFSDITTPSVRYVEGESINTIWAVQSLGIDPQNGKEIYLKKDGTTTYEWDADDQIAAGDAMPTVTGTFGFSSEFKNIGCNLLFYYRLGGQIYNSTLIDKVENADLSFNVDRRVFTDRWQQEGDIARFKSITDQSYTRPTTRFVEDYNTLSLSSVNLYYDFRETGLVKNSFLQQLRFSVNLNDIFMISSVEIERGTDYPFARNATFTLQATF